MKCHQENRICEKNVSEYLKTSCGVYIVKSRYRKLNVKILYYLNKQWSVVSLSWFAQKRYSDWSCFNILYFTISISKTCRGKIEYKWNMFYVLRLYIVYSIIYIIKMFFYIFRYLFFVLILLSCKSGWSVKLGYSNLSW